jgi:hypothetical protein
MAEIEVYENDIEMYLNQFMIDNNIDDLRSASQSVWNACLMYICRYVFKGTDKLKSRELHEQQGFTGLSTFGAYDYEKVDSVCDYYIYLCTLYDKEISQIGFSNLTGINLDTLNQWGNENVKSSKTSTEIYKKLVKFREESLSNKLATGNKNPVGILAILNRHYQWNLPGVSRENNQRQALTAADLPRLGGSGSVPAAQIEGNVSE